MNFHSLTALELAAAVRSRRLTARAITEAALSRISSTHSRLNAFTAVTAERARREANAVDDAIEGGRDPGPLAGVPYGVKNLFDLAGVVTVAGSKINRDHPPATEDATAVDRLRRAGAVCIGALNMGEYAYDFVTENIHDGTTHNPRDLTRSAGGSSGGCGAAVAAGLVPFSLGTDTNGSIRVPSSFCGIWGLKPTYGRLSRAGTYPFVGSLDHIGPFANSVGDLAAVYDALQGPDPRDPACSSRSPDPASASLDEPLVSLRIGIATGYFEKHCPPQARSAVAAVASALGSFRRIDISDAACTRARTAAFLITMAEGGQLHLPDLQKRAGDFDPPIRDRLLAGTLLPAAWYLQAQRYRTWWRDHLREVFRDVDVLLAPSTPVPATAIGQTTMTLEGLEMAVRPNLGIYTQPISFVGLPVVAAPVHSAGPMPIGVQLIGAPWTEAMLLRVARQLENLGVCSAPVANLAA